MLGRRKARSDEVGDGAGEWDPDGHLCHGELRVRADEAEVASCQRDRRAAFFFALFLPADLAFFASFFAGAADLFSWMKEIV